MARRLLLAIRPVAALAVILVAGLLSACVSQSAYDELAGATPATRGAEPAAPGAACNGAGARQFRRGGRLSVPRGRL